MQKLESKIKVYNETLSYIGHEAMLFSEELIIPIYQLINQKYCNYELGDDDGDKYYRRIQPEVFKVLNNTSNKDLLLIKKLLDTLHEVFGFVLKDIEKKSD